MTNIRAWILNILILSCCVQSTIAYLKSLEWIMC